MAGTRKVQPEAPVARKVEKTAGVTVLNGLEVKYEATGDEGVTEHGKKIVRKGNGWKYA